MVNNIENLAVTRAHARADKLANEQANESATAARAAVEAEEDPNVYDPQRHADIQDRADIAYETTFERVHTQAWQPAYDAALNEALRELTPQRPSVAGLEEGEARTFSEPLSRREGRF